MRLVGDSHKQVQNRRSRVRRCPEIGVTCDSLSSQQLRPIVASQMAPNTAAQERLGEIMVFGCKEPTCKKDRPREFVCTLLPARSVNSLLLFRGLSVKFLLIFC